MQLSRRKLLQIGAAGVFGALPFAPPANAGGSPRRRARAKSTIFLHQYGGPSHLDSFDMKPASPPEFRGIYRPIQTSAPGIQICEKLGRMAPHMDKVTLIRTVRQKWVPTCRLRQPDRHAAAARVCATARVVPATARSRRSLRPPRSRNAGRVVSTPHADG